MTTVLKKQPLLLSKIVTVFDDGGSAGRLRDEFGFLPVGDLRQSLAALSRANGTDWIKEVLLYRFGKGKGLEGHNLGNLILLALQDMTGSTPKALEIAAKIFRLSGKVIPVTTDQSNLRAKLEDGSIIEGEHLLDDASIGGKRIVEFGLTKPVKIYEEAREAILEADFIIIGPGDLYASLLANFVVDGVRESLQESKAKVIYILNLMTRFSQTHNYSAQAHLDEVTHYTGRTPDVILVNNAPIPSHIKTAYAALEEYPVKDDLEDKAGIEIIRAPLASKIKIQPNPHDTLQRSLMRHDQHELERILLSIITP